MYIMNYWLGWTLYEHKNERTCSNEKWKRKHLIKRGTYWWKYLSILIIKAKFPSYHDKTSSWNIWVSMHHICSKTRRTPYWTEPTMKNTFFVYTRLLTVFAVGDYIRKYWQKLVLTGVCVTKEIYPMATDSTVYGPTVSAIGWIYLTLKAIKRFRTKLIYSSEI